ncbi:2-dehydro-3-deoxy-6-phosphogalactonate aldolase [Erythrobacter sp. LQ02-29]|uniref:2-dehydro-3-deoxy-6-phosphogalactonate aldolase n=1 Tax=Erythrobacter sp. LQ02-29 TaxID=2920384 RepID=UPI001F4DC0F3|nr:2-dehydro-3-deoxy-6-phosphogalactonate aldolase [Erythrobacter sp. LQ02-29]MCP9222624.1 2-dehydro-3-deoxy-6-phosphogalactonate aldolase [Erythrobacter sp. LQ02-29]
MRFIPEFDSAFSACPLVAILRGVTPDEVEDIGEALVEAGFRLIEVPLNSPEPLDSIARLSEKLRGRAMVGAGTVLSVEQVAQVADAGGQIVVSPNTNAGVIEATATAGLASLPGFATPSEAFAAIDAGATALKLFPAEASSPLALKAARAVLPKELAVLPVGGIEVDSMEPWVKAGASGFGLGSSLYKPGRTPAEVGERAREFVEAWRELSAAQSQ